MLDRYRCENVGGRDSRHPDDAGAGARTKIALVRQRRRAVRSLRMHVMHGLVLHPGHVQHHDRLPSRKRDAEYRREDCASRTRRSSLHGRLSTLHEPGLSRRHAPPASLRLVSNGGGVRTSTTSATHSRTRDSIETHRGWCAWVRDRVVFIKPFGWEPWATYPDVGSNNELYAAGDYLEIETLGPLVTLAPGERTTHIERWFLFRDVDTGHSEREL